MTRAVSTVLDVTLAILLVGGALATLAYAPRGPTDDVGADAADGTADLLGSTTVELEYTVAPAARNADPSLLEFPVESGPNFRRESHGTLAALFAEGATRNVSVDGERISHRSDDFERALAEATLGAIREGDVTGQVRAVWRPFPGSDLRGRVVVGPSPPPDADVHAATMNVSSGFPDGRRRALAAAEWGYGPVAETLANVTVRGLFPPERSELSLHGDYPGSALVTYRYRHCAQLLGTSVADALVEGDARRANELLVAALAERYERTLKEEFETPAAAARNASVGTVTVTVRTWSE